MKALILIALLWLSFGDGLVAPANASTLSQFSSGRPFTLVAPCNSTIAGYSHYTFSTNWPYSDALVIISQAIGTAMIPTSQLTYFCYSNSNYLRFEFNTSNQVQNVLVNGISNCFSTSGYLCIFKNNQY